MLQPPPPAAASCLVCSTLLRCAPVPLWHVHRSQSHMRVNSTACPVPDVVGPASSRSSDAAAFREDMSAATSLPQIIQSAHTSAYRLGSSI